MNKQINNEISEIVLFINGNKVAFGKERHTLAVIIDFVHPEAANLLTDIKNMRESAFIYKEVITSSIEPEKNIIVYSEVFQFIR